jgi:hypothetical protein
VYEPGAVPVDVQEIVLCGVGVLFPTVVKDIPAGKPDVETVILLVVIA